MKRRIARFALAPAMVPVLLAFNATSSSFYVRQNIQSISGGDATTSVSTSASFELVGAGGQTGAGTSTSGTSFTLYAGFLQAMFESVKPVYTQAHYHWRNDNGSETTATSATGGTQDTPLTSLAKNTTARVRIAVSNEGGTQGSYAANQFRLEYGEKSTTCAAIVSWTDVGGVGGAWDMDDSANISNGANTTNIAIATGGVGDANAVFVGSGALMDTSSQSAAAAVASNAFIELEYSVEALAGATDEATYCFRVTDAGSSTLYTYSAYPEVTLEAGTFTFTVTTDTFPAHTPGTPVFATSTLSVTTSNSSGWSVTLYGVNQGSLAASTTMYLAPTTYTTGITDQTEWIAGAATTSAGNAVRIGSLDNSGDVLAFRVMTASGTIPFRASTWWGSADSYVDSASTLWAGISSSTVQRQIGNSSVTSGAVPVLSSVVYYLDTPVTQQTGSYTGDVVYTAFVNP